MIMTVIMVSEEIGKNNHRYIKAPLKKGLYYFGELVS
jgi:hypothetical protein